MPFGGMELIIILVIVLVLFGPSQLPKIGKMLGQTTRSIRDGLESPAEEPEPKPKKKAKPAPIEAADEDEDEVEAKPKTAASVAGDPRPRAREVRGEEGRPEA